MSRMEHDNVVSRPSQSSHSTFDMPQLSRKQALRAQIAEFDAEIETYEAEVRATQALIIMRKGDRQRAINELEAMHHTNKGKGKADTGINYGKEEFEWTRGLKAKMKEVFEIDNFRLCQQGCVPRQLISVPSESSISGSVTPTWMGEISSALCPQVPQLALHVSRTCLTSCYRRRKVSHISTSCSAPTWLHTSHFPTHITHHGPDPTSS